MANTYTQIYIHMVFAVKNRESLLTPDLETEVHKMLTAILTNNGHKMIAIGGMADHVHMLFGMSPTEALSHLVKEMKTSTTSWVNGQWKYGETPDPSDLSNLSEPAVDYRKGLPSPDRVRRSRHFGWQEGYGAFSYSRSQIDAVAHYIQDQKHHHSKRTFREEYLEILRNFNIAHDNRYVFQWITDPSPSVE